MLKPRQDVASAIELRLVISRFAALVDDWRLTDAEVDALLFAPPGRWSAVRSLGRSWVPLGACERRVRLVLEIADSLDRLGRIDDHAGWLRLQRRRPDGTICSIIDDIRSEAGYLDAVRRALDGECAAQFGDGGS